MSQILGQVLGTGGKATLNLLRLPGRKLSERERIKLSAMKCIGKVGVSPAVLNELQMLEWAETVERGALSSFVQMKGLVWGKEEEPEVHSNGRANKSDNGNGEGGDVDVFNLIDFSSDEEEGDDAENIVDYGVGVLMGAGAGASTSKSIKKKEDEKTRGRKNHAADPGHAYHFVTSEECVLSLRAFKTLFTRRRAKGYEPPMKLPVSFVRSLFRDLLQIAKGCHSIGCVLGKSGNFKEYFGLDTFLMNEAGQVKLSSVSACSPWVRADRDQTGLRHWGALSSEEKKKIKTKKVGVDKMKYASPEILLGSQRITPASDVWAIGILILNLAAGKNHFVNEKEPGMSATLYEITKLAGTISETDKNFEKGKKMPKFKKYEEYIAKLQKKITAKGGKKKKYKVAFGKGVGIILGGGEEWAEFCDVMDQMMKMDPDVRPTATQILKHPFFSRIEEGKDAKDWLDVRKCLEVLPKKREPRKRKRETDADKIEEENEKEEDDFVAKLLMSNEDAMDDVGDELYGGI